MSSDSAAKFDASRAGEYEQQSRIALAGYDACHELAAALLAATLGQASVAKILVAGVGGTANEILIAGALEPNWTFVAVDPSQPMLDLAISRVTAAGLIDRTKAVLGTVADLPPEATFDAATLMGVLHHLPGDAAKRGILRDIATRLKPGAPLILACNHMAYAAQPTLLAAWGQRWRMQGASPDEVKAKLGKILQGADPPQSETDVADLLADAGFEPPLRFFSSLFWGLGWLGAMLEQFPRICMTVHRVQRSRPIRARRAEIARDPDRVMDILRQGTARANAVTNATKAELQEALGLFTWGDARIS